MNERREIKVRSPAVWARVREAYLIGEPAASVARRFDVGVSNLRHRAIKEGWTRQAAARADLMQAAPALNPARQEAEAPDVEKETYVCPEVAVNRALRRAAWLISEGRAAEATTLMRAAQTLSALTGAPMPAQLFAEMDAKVAVADALRQLR